MEGITACNITTLAISRDRGPSRATLAANQGRTGLDTASEGCSLFVRLSVLVARHGGTGSQCRLGGGINIDPSAASLSRMDAAAGAGGFRINPGDEYSCDGAVLVEIVNVDIEVHL